MPPACYPLSDIRPLDPERLAALIDGRLDAASAEAVREQLADADDVTVAAFADAVAISRLGSSEAAGETATISSIWRASKRPAWVVGSLALAATIMVAVFLARQTPSSHDDIYVVVMGTPARASSIEPAWELTRGTGAAVSESARAARVGVLVTDLIVQVSRRDSAFAGTAGQLAVLLDGVPAAGLMADKLRSIAAMSVSQVDSQALREVSKRSMQLLDETFARAGALLEAARRTPLGGASTLALRAALRAAAERLSGESSLAPTARHDAQSLARDGADSNMAARIERLLREITR